MNKINNVEQCLHFSLVGHMADREVCEQELTEYQENEDGGFDIVASAIDEGEQTFEIVVTKQRPIMKTKGSSANLFEELLSFINEFEVYSPHFTDFIRGGKNNGTN